MDKNLFQQAKEALMDMLNMDGEATETDQQATQQAIDAAYQEASPEEQQQLQQLENQLKEKNQLNG